MKFQITSDLEYDNVFNRLIYKGNYIYSNTREFENINTKSIKPRALELILGYNCNFRCVYCSQNTSKCISDKIDVAKIIEYIYSLDLTECADIELWGGEPLLYFNQIKEIMQEFKHLNLIWKMVSNGSLLSHAHLDFLENYKFNISFSHDGPVHNELRLSKVGNNNFDLSKKIDILKRVEKSHPISFNIVMSRYNCDFMKVHEYFSEFFKKYEFTKPFMLFTMPFYFTDFYDPVLEYTQKEVDILKATIREFLEQKYIQKDTSLFWTHVDIELQNMVKSILGNTKQCMARCGTDYDQSLSIDFKGNVLWCNNKEEILGSVDDLIENGIIKTPNYASLCAVKSKCKSCKVRYFCKGTCPLSKKYGYWEHNCQSFKALYETIFDFMLEGYKNARF